MIKRLIFLLVLIAITFSLVTSCSDGGGIFSYCEANLPLGDGFKSVSDENFDAVWSNGKYTMALLRISFVAGVSEGIAETMTPYEFGLFWLDRCARDANLIKDGSVYCEYYGFGESGAEEVFYLEAFYRSAYAYFVILFAAPAADEEAGRVDFLSYASNVYFLT
ncbi:MAG: hypothetical protein E7612_05225 [Ruminococcaceae bacterium]|nr:hypothetical protein [Oscillospiraceae bacterium]